MVITRTLCRGVISRFRGGSERDEGLYDVVQVRLYRSKQRAQDGVADAPEGAAENVYMGSPFCNKQQY